MAEKQPFATFADVAAVTGDDYDTAAQARLTLLLAGISRSVRRECGWHVFPSVSETVTVDGSGALTQMLPTLHLTDVAAVTEDGEAVDLANVEWTEKGYLRRSWAWTRKLRGVSATITHGLDADAVTDLRDLVVGIALERAWVIVRPGAGAVSQLATGPFSGRWDVSVDFDDEQLAVLAPYMLNGGG